jgi:hypothetical protein
LVSSTGILKRGISVAGFADTRIRSCYGIIDSEHRVVADNRAPNVNGAGDDQPRQAFLARRRGWLRLEHSERDRRSFKSQSRTWGRLSYEKAIPPGKQAQSQVNQKLDRMASLLLSEKSVVQRHILRVATPGKRHDLTIARLISK